MEGGVGRGGGGSGGISTAGEEARVASESQEAAAHSADSLAEAVVSTLVSLAVAASALDFITCSLELDVVDCHPFVGVGYLFLVVLIGHVSGWVADNVEEGSAGGETGGDNVHAGFEDGVEG